MKPKVSLVILAISMVAAFVTHTYNPHVKLIPPVSGGVKVLKWRKL